MTHSSLSGRGLLQSPEQWERRTELLADAMTRLVLEHAPPGFERGLDVGCQGGELADVLMRRTSAAWAGIDPKVKEPVTTDAGARLQPGLADSLPFPSSHFGCVIFANVYEHIPPAQSQASLGEIARVLQPGGVLIGQLPNPYFPIESHSRLPFMGWLPPSAQRHYWKLSPTTWAHDFYAVTIRDLRRRSHQAGLEPVMQARFNYPREVIPKAVRWASGIMRVVPWSWQFVFVRRDPGDA